MLLSTIVFLPLVGALLVMLAGGGGDRPEREGTVRAMALAVSLVAFAATLLLWWRFNPADADFQFVENRVWLPQFGISYHLGVDGISLFLVVLTGFLTPLALLTSWQSVHKSVKLFSFFLLALESAMLGVFVSIDLFLFYIFWDAMLIPMYFLIGIWGYERRIYAAVKFILYTMGGSVLMLLAIIGLAYLHRTVTGVYSFDVLRLYELPIPPNLQFWFFLAFVLGIAAMNTQGVQGAVYQMLNHGVSTGGLFLIVGMLSDRRHTRLIRDYGGLKKVVPHLVAAFLIITLASIGLPGLNGFVGEFLILLGAFRWDPRLAAFAATGVILSASYMLWMFQRVYYGPVTNEKNATPANLWPREWAAIGPIIAVAILMGVLPNLFLRPIEPSVDRIVNHFHQGAPARIQAASPPAPARERLT